MRFEKSLFLKPSYNEILVFDPVAPNFRNIKSIKLTENAQLALSGQVLKNSIFEVLVSGNFSFRPLKTRID